MREDFWLLLSSFLLLEKIGREMKILLSVIFCEYFLSNSEETCYFKEGLAKVTFLRPR